MFPAILKLTYIGEKSRVIESKVKELTKYLTIKCVQELYFFQKLY